MMMPFRAGRPHKRKCRPFFCGLFRNSVHTPHTRKALREYCSSSEEAQITFPHSCIFTIFSQTFQMDSEHRRIMGGGTRYSRSTWQKDQLHASVSNAPKYGNKACNLCDRARTPDDLTFKVSKYKTCGDVHLELSLLNPAQATCQAGQDAYRNICCKKSFLPDVNPKPVVSVAVGILLFWIFAKKARRVSCAPIRKNRSKDLVDDDEDSDDDDLEQSRARSSYKRMTDDGAGSHEKKRSRSKSRDRALVKTSRSKSRDRNGTKRSKSKDASRSTKKTDNVVQTFQINKKDKKKSAFAQRMQKNFQLHKDKQRREMTEFVDDTSADAYYHLDEDPSFNEDSTMAGNTMAGDTIDAVVTQVV